MQTARYPLLRPCSTHRVTVPASAHGRPKAGEAGSTGAMVPRCRRLRHCTLKGQAAPPRAGQLGSAARGHSPPLIRSECQQMLLPEQAKPTLGTLCAAPRQAAPGDPFSVAGRRCRG